MKSKIAVMVAAGLLVAAMPAGARPMDYSSWSECAASLAADDPFDQWEGTCAAKADGTWHIVWTKVKKVNNKKK